MCPTMHRTALTKKSYPAQMSLVPRLRSPAPEYCNWPICMDANTCDLCCITQADLKHLIDTGIMFVWLTVNPFGSITVSQDTFYLQGIIQLPPSGFEGSPQLTPNLFFQYYCLLVSFPNQTTLEKGVASCSSVAGIDEASPYRNRSMFFQPWVLDSDSTGRVGLFSLSHLLASKLIAKVGWVFILTLFGEKHWQLARECSCPFHPGVTRSAHSVWCLAHRTRANIGRMAE